MSYDNLYNALSISLVSLAKRTITRSYFYYAIRMKNSAQDYHKT